MTSAPSVSVIINTDARAKALAVCLESLRYLRYPNFEVVVVRGPTEDGTRELLAGWGGALKVGYCPDRNLSRSRNIAIELASGDFVGFLDDDSIPEPEWLEHVMPAFADAKVGVAGGFLLDHTGKAFQWRFGTLDRFGAADESWQRPAPEYNFPNSFNFPHVMANSVFRRAAVQELGGFDEEYEYFLDESDIICRLVDAGWTVAQLDRGFIHHKFMPSHIRNESRVLTSWYSLIKNKTYFSLLNAGRHVSADRIIETLHNFVEVYRKHVDWAIDLGLLSVADRLNFEDEANRALRAGLEHGLAGRRQLAEPGRLAGDATPFHRFEPLLPAGRQRCLLFLTHTYPPGSLGGIGRYIHQLARALGALGHQIHVLTQGAEHDRVDFEDGVWVHRIIPRSFPVPPASELGAAVPAHIWNYSRTLFAEAEEIAGRRPVDCVYAPIWDVEGIAFLHEHRFPLVTSLQTTLHFYLESNPDLRADKAFMADFATPMLALERRLLAESDGIHAISQAIADEIAEVYQVALAPPRTAVIPLAIEDWAGGPLQAPPPLPAGGLRIVFVGRLEARKGIDLLLAAALPVLASHPEVYLDIVGNDTIAGPGGMTYRASFEATADPALRARVRFHGEVPEAALKGFYQACDLFVAPSRFESFGLILVEAMMFGKPVIACRAGGMPEVIEEGVTGLLAEPGDVASLADCLERLIVDAGLRQRLGAAGRQRFESHFTPRRLATAVEGFLAEVSRRATGDGA
ncbi:glycosyltransferase [Telmatospirillum sp.]|uniref:glycosyltransferase n=1 Tax=Telmatospirillum sp. TaxID=2079197 RepID=UPI002840F13E|nr:glycosyltransferase [Telmatospirillum sp.]MDR3435678.1 glycosyltransferase [Telmatospirillum sp.]